MEPQSSVDSIAVRRNWRMRWKTSYDLRHTTDFHAGLWRKWWKTARIDRDAKLIKTKTQRYTCSYHIAGRKQKALCSGVRSDWRNSSKRISMSSFEYISNQRSCLSSLRTRIRRRFLAVHALFTSSLVQGVWNPTSEKQNRHSSIRQKNMVGWTSRVRSTDISINVDIVKTSSVCLKSLATK